MDERDDKAMNEELNQPSCLGAVISNVFEGEVTAMSWDIDQWAFMVDGEWYCQSEINCL
jgi:hypothetical protein